MTLAGIPVLQYDGLGAALPSDVSARLASHWVTPVGLARQLALIRELGHRVVRLYDAWASEDEGTLARAPVVLSFDDGRNTDYEIAFPLLLAAGMRAEFFVNTAAIGQRGYLGWSRITEMLRAGMSFQSHAHDHVALPTLPSRQLSHSLRVSKRMIEDRVGRAVDFLAAPHGLVDRRVVDAAQDAGYQAVCASRGWPARPGAAIVNRIVVRRDTTEPELGAILARQTRAYIPAIARTFVDRLRYRAARPRVDADSAPWSAYARDPRCST
jgi:peptidoglycan/xylan/chitin deacetylase (PgdA/CDA1 family)